MRIDTLDISASGLRAQRLRMETIANNMANLDTTASGETIAETDADGNTVVRQVPYRRRVPIFSIGMPGHEGEPIGVSVPLIAEDTKSSFRRVHDPDHPHAVKDPNSPDNGFVLYPNVDPMIETVDMIAATRAYEANITAIEALKNMGEAALRILA